MALSYTTAAVTPTVATNYINARALSGWPTNTADQAAALRRAQDYIARTYNELWAEEFTDATAPETVKYAIIEAALVEAKEPGILSPTVKPIDAKVLTGVGSISWQPVSLPGGVDALVPRLLHVEALLAEHLKDATIHLTRA
jgi:hypothetical protein